MVRRERQNERHRVRHTVRNTQSKRQKRVERAEMTTREQKSAVEILRSKVGRNTHPINPSDEDFLAAVDDTFPYESRRDFLLVSMAIMAVYAETI